MSQSIQAIEAIKQVIDSVPHVPSSFPDAEHPIAGVLAGAAIAIYPYIRDRKEYRHNEEQHTITLSNADLAAKHFQDEPEDVRKTRMRPTLLAYGGAGLLVASLIASPEYETNKLDSSANAIVVQDVSDSMMMTKDLGNNTSRFEAVNRPIRSAKYNGSLGMIQTSEQGNDPRVVFRLSKSQYWKKQFSQTEKHVESMESQIAPAVELADSLLPVNPKTGKGHEGTIIIESDGGTQDQVQDINEAIAKAKAAGTKVKVIVPGTSAGNYRLHSYSDPIPAETKPALFNGVGVKDVHQVESTKAAEKAVHQELTSIGNTEEHKHGWYTLAALGGALGLTGAYRSIRQTAKKAK